MCLGKRKSINMKNKVLIETLDKFKELLYKTLNDELKRYSVETLELFAVYIYEMNNNIRYKYIEILDSILYARYRKLNHNFEWTDENKRKFLSISDKFMQVYELANDEAISIANDLENRMNKNDKFMKDYEIDIEIDAYMSDQFYTDKNGKDSGIGYVLSEPVSGFNFLYDSFGHSIYDHTINRRESIWLDRTLNWNIEFFGNTFKYNYICYAIHALIEQGNWSFKDIIDIKKIWADVKVSHQYYEEIP